MLQSSDDAVLAINFNGRTLRIFDHRRYSSSPPCARTIGAALTAHVVTRCFSSEGQYPSPLQSTASQALIFQPLTFINVVVLPVVRHHVVSLLVDNRIVHPCIVDDCCSSPSSFIVVRAIEDHVVSASLRIANDIVSFVHPIVLGIFILTIIFLQCIFP